MERKENYCSKCDMSGYMMDGSICDCQWGQKIKEQKLEQYKKEQKEDIIRKGIIPDNYGEEFCGEFIREPYNDTLGEYLDNIHQYIKTNKVIPKNILVCSPPRTGKTVFQYSIISWAINNNVNYCKPLFISDISNMINDKSQIENMSKIMTTPIVFVNIDESVVLGFVDIISTIISKRVNIGYSTMFFSASDYNALCKKPTGSKLRELKGDGLYKSIDIQNFFIEEGEI